jgi:MFS family permease
MHRTASSGYRFLILILVVIVAGASQGLLLPLLTILLEKSGVSSGTNGMNAAALYIGTFLAMLGIERPVRRFGYKKIIAAGILLVTACTLLFPLSDSLVIWFLLRVGVGIGDSALHYASQLWITSSSPADKRGRNISLYGMSYGLGFSIGPLGINLLPLGRWVPFAAISILYLAVFLLLLRMNNENPLIEEREATASKRFKTALSIGWYALIPSFLYGYMESTTNSNFPVYGLRAGMSEQEVSLILPAIGLGSLILQFPLGLLSDRKGRKPVLMAAGLLGSLAFLAVPFAGNNLGMVFVLFLLAGGLVGSFFSLGLAYTADLLPKAILPAANVIASINFSVGSIVGPNLGGIGIQYLGAGSVFYLLGAIFLVFTLLGFLYRRNKADQKSSLIHFTN